MFLLSIRDTRPYLHPEQTLGHSASHSPPQCGLSPAVCPLIVFLLPTHSPHPTDDSAAHISEETAGAARAAPIAILVGVAATATLGWLSYIAASFALVSVSDLLATELALPMGQLFLDVLGKRGMLAIWSLIIVVQVRCCVVCCVGVGVVLTLTLRIVCDGSGSGR